MHISSKLEVIIRAIQYCCADEIHGAAVVCPYSANTCASLLKSCRALPSALDRYSSSTRSISLGIVRAICIKCKLG